MIKHGFQKATIGKQTYVQGIQDFVLLKQLTDVRGILFTSPSLSNNDVSHKIARKMRFCSEITSNDNETPTPVPTI